MKIKKKFICLVISSNFTPTALGFCSTFNLPITQFFDQITNWITGPFATISILIGSVIIAVGIIFNPSQDGLIRGLARLGIGCGVIMSAPAITTALGIGNASGLGF